MMNDVLDKEEDQKNRGTAFYDIRMISMTSAAIRSGEADAPST